MNVLRSVKGCATLDRINKEENIRKEIDTNSLIRPSEAPVFNQRMANCNLLKRKYLFPFAHFRIAVLVLQKEEYSKWLLPLSELSLLALQMAPVMYI